MLYGLLDLSFWGYVFVALAMMHFTVMSITLYLHRNQCHRGIDLHPAVQHVCRFWLWLTTGMQTKAWVAIHRKHHAKVETEEDPHSPVICGIKKVLLEGAELYRAETKNPETMEKYGQGSPNDWIERHLYTPYTTVGLGLLFFINIALFGLPGITIWALQMLTTPILAAGVINGLGHYIGYRNYECKDASRNVLPIGIIAGGEELHNNHHTYGSSAKFSVKWWEFDIGWMYICILRVFRLAKVRRRAPAAKIVTESRSMQVDADALRAIISNRFQVMSQYTKNVLVPVFNDQKRHASAKRRHFYTRGLRNVLGREKSLVTEQDRMRVSTLVQNCSTMRSVCDLQEKLHAIWGRTSASQKELLEAMQDWCKQAEKTGIKALNDFAQLLRCYQLKRYNV